MSIYRFALGITIGSTNNPTIAVTSTSHAIQVYQVAPTNDLGESMLLLSSLPQVTPTSDRGESKA